MLSNVGHTIQKMINNTPIAVTVNDTTTEVVTNGGNVYQTGLIENRIHDTFQEVISSSNMVGQVTDAEATDAGVYLLSSTGSVFEYNYDGSECGPLVREVYSPMACGGDKAVRIVSGRSHVLILTENNKVWGVGSNNEYQLVPQGQCRYDTAVELLVTDTNLHDNDCCGAFTGTFNEMTHPVIPQCESNCNDITCIKDTKCDILLGYLNVSDATVTPPNKMGTLGIPVFGDISYVGFLCVDRHNCVSGTLNYTITRMYVRCGCFVSKFTTMDSCGCHVKEFDTSSTTEIVIFQSSNCMAPNTDSCVTNGVAPITGAAQINGKCGSCVTVNIDLPNGLPLPGVMYDFDCKTILLELNDVRSSLTALCSTSFTGLETSSVVDIALDFDVPLNCAPSRTQKQVVELPQPCWSNVYAGGDVSALVDSCNRLYVLGSLHQIRSNKDLLRGNCLEDLLNKTHASISFPADQLNCAGNRTHRNNRCQCAKCKDKEFKTDLTKFGINLSFPGGDECSDKNMNVCEFLNKLKRCNEAQSCEPTCEPCDSYIHLNVSGECGCPCGAPTSEPIGSVTLLNKKSVCKLVSQNCPDVRTLRADLNTIVEFDLNKYCIDATDVPLDQIVKLDFCADGPNVNVYLDTDTPGGVKFTSNGRKCNVDFTVTASTETRQFILNYGSILDPVELTNLKYALSLDSYYPCPKYKNPFDTKITNTYLRGGDHVRFTVGNPKNIRQAVTADVPTVFRLNRRIVDIAVGNNNLTVLVGGLACPNDIMAIGSNCHGELGLGNNETVVCWKTVNRCQFNCQVNQVFAGKNVTFYITQSNQLFGAGQWKCFVDSTSPKLIKSVCQSWKIKQIAISRTHIILLGGDGCIFGLGDNTMGELGLGHVDCVPKPVPLAFFYHLNKSAVRNLNDNLRPRGRGVFNPCDFGGCGPVFPECGPFDCGDQGGCPFKPVKNSRHGAKKYNPNGRICNNNRYKY